MSELEFVSTDTQKQKFEVKKNEQKTFIIFLGKNKETKLELEIRLVGKGARADILGIIVGKDKQNHSLYILQNHQAPNTTSDLHVKGVFFDESKFRYQGLIRVSQNAQNSSALQREDNLLLSDKVHLNTKPQLEIEANEVTCTHAATASKIDRDQLFYLQSRGIDPSIARKLVIRGFLSEIVMQIKDEKLKKKLDAKVDNLLN